MPKISVVMPAYNAEAFLQTAIDSILRQTLTDFEFLIINDGSTDRSEEIILQYNDPRIVYIKNEKNLGVAATLNRGLALAKGEYIARMDSDDISCPARFSLQAAYLDAHPEVGLCGGSVIPFSDEGDQEIRRFSADHNTISADLLFHSAFSHPAVMMRRSVLTDTGLCYDPKFFGCEDFRLWTQLAGATKLANLPDVLLYYRKHANQITKIKSPALRTGLLSIRSDYLQHCTGLSNSKAIELFHMACEKEPLSGEDIQVLSRFLSSIYENWTLGARPYLKSSLNGLLLSVLEAAGLSPWQAAVSRDLGLNGQFQWLRRKWRSHV